MRTLTSLAYLSALSLLVACGSQGGYYDANNNYIEPPHSATNPQHARAPSDEQSSRNYHRERHYDRYADAAPYTYERRGYYDSNGYYIEGNDDVNVPEGMFPPRGMCRVWFTNRFPSRQPVVESCDNIHSRVPAGAYVIYGG